MSQDSLLMSLEVFEKFGEAYVTGLRPRVEGEVSSDGPEISPSNRGALAGELAGGALLARTIWGGEDAESTGCFLWIGTLTGLLGDADERPVSSLNGEEIEALNTSLRLNVEEGGDDRPPLEWAGLESISADDLDARLNEIGVPEEFERARLEVQVGEQSFAFLFLRSTQQRAQPTAGAPAAPEAVSAPEVGETAPEPAAATPGEPEAGPAAATPTEAPAPATSTAPATTLETAAAAPAFRNLDPLMNVRLPLTIRLGSLRMNLDELLHLTPGAILELDRHEDEPLEVLANGQVVAHGEVVVVDERFGLRITEIGSATDRIRAL